MLAIKDQYGITMSKYSFPPKTKFYIGTANPDGTFGTTLTPRVYKDQCEEVFRDFWEFISPKDGNNESHTYYVLPQSFIDEFAQTIRNNFREDLETLYEKLKTDDINSVIRRFNTRETAIIQGKYKDDAEALATDCINVVLYQKELFLKTPSILLLNAGNHNRPANSPIVVSNIKAVYEYFGVMRNLYGISLLVDANTKYFKENVVLKHDFEEIETYILELLEKDKDKLNRALCWSLLNDLELAHNYENMRGEKFSDTERQDIINASIFRPNPWYVGKPWYDNHSNYQKMELDLTDTWVTHYLTILQMLKEIRYLKFAHKLLLTRYEAQFDTDVVQDPELDQTLYLAKDIFTSAIPILKPQ